MRQIFLSQVIMFILLACSQQAKLPENSTSNAGYGPFTIKRGTNIAHWLSQSNRRGNERASFFTEKDIVFIKSAGFDHIRLPVDEQQLWDSTGKRYDDAFQLLDSSLTWANRAGLRVVLDLHILRSHHFNEAEKPLWTQPAAQDKFIQLWKDLAGAVKKWPNGMLAYEFMNEPVADDPEQWNVLLARVADSIRSWERERVLVIGSNRWQSANTFDQLRIPANDKNILLSFHFYEPFHLTHYKASWTRLKDFNGQVQYPGQIVVNGTADDEKKVYNRETLEKMMAKPIHLADSLKLPLYCGEFGVIDGSPRESKVAWYKDLITIFEKHNIAYANWNYKSGSFGIVDATIKPDTEMVNILAGKK
ncbi:MAG TPA: cellulase family glycosylhydrolase [Flavitalea sp.]|nr:cellulase family glycosylhydrolase [Flavitalea sp.]